jgi:RloB-like protein
VCRLAIQKRFQLAISNPCFEFWLLLHKEDSMHPAGKCSDVSARLRAVMGHYNKTNLDLSEFKSGVDIAIQRAKQLDTNPQSRWPAHEGTHVYKLVESLIQFTSGSKTNS